MQVRAVILKSDAACWSSLVGGRKIHSDNWVMQEMKGYQFRWVPIGKLASLLFVNRNACSRMTPCCSDPARPRFLNHDSDPIACGYDADFSPPWRFDYE